MAIEGPSGQKGFATVNENYGWDKRQVPAVNQTLPNMVNGNLAD
jgi:hypothetical protein